MSNLLPPHGDEGSIRLDVPFCEPEVVGQVIERRVEFVVERRAVLAVAFQLQGGTSMPPSQGSRIHRCGVHKELSNPNIRVLCWPTWALNEIFSARQNASSTRRMCFRESCQKGGWTERWWRHGATTCPNCLRGTSNRCSSHRAGSCPAAASGANVASVEAGEGGVHPQARGLHRGHGGLN